MHQLLPPTFYENMLYQHHRVVSCPVRSDNNSNSNNVLSSYTLFVYTYVCTVHDKEMAFPIDFLFVVVQYIQDPQDYIDKKWHKTHHTIVSTTTEPTDLSGPHTVATCSNKHHPK